LPLGAAIFPLGVPAFPVDSPGFPLGATARVAPTVAAVMDMGFLQTNPIHYLDDV